MRYLPMILGAALLSAGLFAGSGPAQAAMPMLALDRSAAADTAVEKVYYYRRYARRHYRRNYYGYGYNYNTATTGPTMATATDGIMVMVIIMGVATATKTGHSPEHSIVIAG